jgi:hypothetical protein
LGSRDFDSPQLDGIVGRAASKCKKHRLGINPSGADNPNQRENPSDCQTACSRGPNQKSSRHAFQPSATVTPESHGVNGHFAFVEIFFQWIAGGYQISRL